MSKEKIMREELAPLVKQIGEICSEHAIDYVMAFDVHTEEEPELIAAILNIGENTVDPVYSAAKLIDQTWPDDESKITVL